VLFLHGFMGRGEDWRDVSAGLGRGFFRVAADLPGHGASLGMPPDRHAMEGAARSVLDVLDGAGVGRATVVGYSMGGRLALYLALRHPDRCAGLFLESASPGLEDAGEREARRRADEQKAARLEGGDLRGFLEDWYRQPLFAPLAWDRDLLRRTIDDKMRNDPAGLAASLRSMGTGNQPSLWAELPDLQVPALAVAGELDEKFVGISRRTASLAPMMRPAVVPGAGHNVHAEAPEAYLALLRHFLSGVHRDQPRK
jgi:2-succinyl-6-hydroxy-2,4-cyclohexadiene-1-carboxylate synthase